MDPDQVLNDIVNLTDDILGNWREECQAEELAEKITALIEWLAKGGFAPDWQKAVKAAKG